ncbi:clostripain-related cysteine peptidase [Candidatus Neomarinimicrobiota bacterium]
MKIIQVGFFILIVQLLFSCNSPNQPTVNDIKPWTFLFYADEDYFPSYRRFQDFKNSMCSSDNINVIVLEDQDYAPAHYWYIDEGHKAILLEDLDEINMGSQSTLEEFIKYGKKNYPADRYILGMYNHGFGWVGGFMDETNDNDWLTPQEISKAIQSNGKIDILLMMACSMGSLEVVYQLGDFTDVFIGSENSTTYDFFGCAWEDILSYINNNTYDDTFAVGSKIIDFIWDHSTDILDHNYYFDLTMSAIRTDRIELLVQHLDELSLQYLDNFHAFETGLNNLFINIKNYRNNRVDFINVIELLSEVEQDNDIKLIQNQIINDYQNIIINECHGEGVLFSNGISIYLPIPGIENYTNYYSSDVLNNKFVIDTHWDELLERYYQSTNQLIVDEIPLHIHGSIVTN